MKKEMKKKILTGTIAAAAVIAGAWGILFAVRRTNEKPVRVYKVSEVAQTDYWADQQSTYGMVAPDQLQNVFLTSTQTVSEIFVQKGQRVRPGILCWHTIPHFHRSILRRRKMISISRSGHLILHERNL